MKRQSLRGLAKTQWDVIVIGGGISGAGVACAAARCGVKTLLLEQRDFASGSSSRSSKMVHGGLRYLAQGNVRLVREAVRERERFLREAPGLVDPQTYLFPHYHKQRPYSWQVGCMLRVYDLFAGVKHRQPLKAMQSLKLIPGLREHGLISAHQFTDAATDDARLVIRVLKEAIEAGAHVRNYSPVTRVWRDEQNKIRGVYAQDQQEGEEMALSARVVINATGAWSDRLRSGMPKIRPLRGSHLVLPHESLPVKSALMTAHPVDGRTVFIFPWSGCTIIGTTEVDHEGDLQDEPAITQDELDYLLLCGNDLFPASTLTRQTVRSTWAGVRPVVGRNAAHPSRVSREHAVWVEDGLFTLAGGKLTTFRLMARDVLEKASRILPALSKSKRNERLFRDDIPLAPGMSSRLMGWYGKDIEEIVKVKHENDRVLLPGTDYSQAEVRYIAHNEAVLHLDDLMLRRTRLGLITPQGGEALLPLLKELIGWESDRWATEVTRYLALWRKNYYLPAECITT